MDAKKGCFRCGQMGHTFHTCPNTNIIGCKTPGCKKDHNPLAHKNTQKYLSKAKDRKAGKKVEVKVVEVEGQSTTNTTAAPDQAQSQAQSISRSEYATIQASFKMLTEKQAQADDARLCFAKVFSPADGSLIRCIEVQENDESDKEQKSK